MKVEIQIGREDQHRNKESQINNWFDFRFKVKVGGRFVQDSLKDAIRVNDFYMITIETKQDLINLIKNKYNSNNIVVVKK